MTEKRCIAVGHLKDEKDFKKTSDRWYNVNFCNSCWEGETEEENMRFLNIYLSYGKEAFALEYPEPRSALFHPVEIPEDKDELKSMLERLEKNLESRIRSQEESLKNMDSSNEYYRKIGSDISQLKSYYTTVHLKRALG